MALGRTFPIPVLWYQVVKDNWPPKEAKNIETIAASFVPPKTGSAVRLFNLAVSSDCGFIVSMTLLACFVCSHSHALTHMLSLIWCRCRCLLPRSPQVDVPAAGLHDGTGKTLADQVKYTLGSTWAPVGFLESASYYWLVNCCY